MNALKITAALLAVALCGQAIAQQNNRAQMRRPTAGNAPLANQNLQATAAFGPNVIDLQAANIQRIQPDWDSSAAFAKPSIARFLAPQQTQQLMSANGIGPAGPAEVLTLGKRYQGPAGQLAMAAYCAHQAYVDNGGRMVTTFLVGGCGGGFHGLYISYVPAKNSGGVLLDCAFEASEVTALVGTVLGRDANNSFTLKLGETTQTFPPKTNGSFPIAVKIKPGNDAPVSVRIDTPAGGGTGLISLYGCNVTPLL